MAGLALDHLNMDSCDDALPADAGNKAEILDRTAEEVVSRVWNQTSMNSISDIITATVEDYDDKFCSCEGG